MHGLRIAGMKTAGDIGGRHQLQQRAIVRTAFTEIGI
jgi:hypothetical protein